MIVRHARDTDREFIVGLAPRFAEFDLPPWLRRDDVAMGTAQQLERALVSSDDRSAILIAEEHAERLGFAWVLLIPDFYGGPALGKISEIAVARDGLGVGSLLMQASEEWARARGCRRIVLNVMEGNHRARAFYEQHGFAPEYTMLVKRLEVTREAQESRGT